MVLPYFNIHILDNYIILLCAIHHMESYRTDPTYMYKIISKNLPTIPTPSMRFMLGSGTELVGRFRLFSSVRYCVLPGAVWCGAVHTFSHTQILNKNNPKYCFCHYFIKSYRINLASSIIFIWKCCYKGPGINRKMISHPYSG